MKIEEGNLFIVEFMGTSVDAMTYKNDYRYRNEHSLEYHSSWDWLMPVIQKIRNTDKDMPLMYYTALIEGNIEKMHKEVIKCITAHNDIKKNKK